MYDFANHPLNNSDSMLNNSQPKQNNHKSENPTLSNPYFTILGALKVNSKWNASPVVMKNLQFIGLVTPVGDANNNTVRTNQKEYILTNLGTSYVNYAYPIQHDPSFFKYNPATDNIVDHPNKETQDMYTLRQQSYLANAKNRLYQIIQTKVNNGQGHLTEKEFLMFLNNNNVKFNNNFDQFFNIVTHNLFTNDTNSQDNQANTPNNKDNNKDNNQSTNIFNRPLQDDDSDFNPNDEMKNPASDTLNDIDKSDNFQPLHDAFDSDTGLNNNTTLNHNDSFSDSQWSDFWDN